MAERGAGSYCEDTAGRGAGYWVKWLRWASGYTPTGIRPKGAGYSNKDTAGRPAPARTRLRCAACNGTAGCGAGCYCNGMAGHYAAYPGAAYFNKHTLGRGAACISTAGPGTGDNKAGRRVVYNGTAGRPVTARKRLGAAPPTTARSGAAPRTTRQPGKDTARRHVAYNGTARRGADNNNTAQHLATHNNTLRLC